MENVKNVAMTMLVVIAGISSSARTAAIDPWLADFTSTTDYTAGNLAPYSGGGVGQQNWWVSTSSSYPVVITTSTPLGNQQLKMSGASDYTAYHALADASGGAVTEDFQVAATMAYSGSSSSALYSTVFVANTAKATNGAAFGITQTVAGAGDVYLQYRNWYTWVKVDANPTTPELDPIQTGTYYTAVATIHVSSYLYDIQFYDSDGDLIGSATGARNRDNVATFNRLTLAGSASGTSAVFYDEIAVPEPATIGLLLVGGVCAMLKKRHA